MRISDWSSDVCSSDLAGSRLQRIPGSANRADDVLHVGEVQRLAKTSDMDIDGALVDIDVVPPDPVEKLRAGEDAAGRGYQELQKTKLGRAEAHFAALAMDAVGLAVELYIAAFQHRRKNLGARPAQHGFHTRHQFGRREWLDDVIVGAGRQPADP